jgi:hypothetical protein
LRGNTLLNYKTGIYDLDAELFLKDHWNGSQWQALGRNIFNYVDSYSPGGTLFDVFLSSSDGSTGNINVKCGGNKFNTSTASHYHLGLGGGSATRTIDCSTNNWQSTSTPKVTTNITVTGGTFGTDRTPSGTHCGPFNYSSSFLGGDCYAGTVSIIHEKKVVTIMSSDVGNDTIVVPDYLSELFDTTLSFSERRGPLGHIFRDALFADDSVRSSQLQTFIDTVSHFLDQNIPDGFKRRILLFEGDAYRALGDSINASKSYRKITDMKLFNLDSLEAGWGIQYLDSGLGKVRSGFALASSMSHYQHRVIADIRRLYPMFDSSSTDTSTSGQTDKHQNKIEESISQNPVISSLKAIPNPFSDKIDFTFTLAYPQQLKLEIYNELGTKLLVKDIGIQSSGEDSYELNTHNWPNGTYLARILTGSGEVKTVKLVHEK